MENDKKESGNGAPTNYDGQQNTGNSTPIEMNFQIIINKESGNGAPTNYDVQQNTGNSTPIELNFQIIMMPPGIMLIINIVSIETL